MQINLGVLTEEEIGVLMNLSEKPELNIRKEDLSDRYYGVRKNDYSDEPDDIQTMDTLLKKVIHGFYRFYNFVEGTDTIRFGYDYNYGLDNSSFDGVGYITIKELLDGFNEGSK